ncbi:exopolysaccharide biosynthesis polyprenyl glycosylphosphotransferase [Hydrogenovibrio marinus]|uniref:Bacterial sugar transferase domain-containing protein n=1 Tax=Hydrogenovibrio marinus TaxID=28885 RepID=A0A067A342_HYDMR|nr:exopolysaccharide biosynthesis polyprenyl glycosylphosphotransferase [Hydrogenovibrio marinus]KDN96760.1 hypothetical protein EI16_10985 [Hydrogenovibrio marinus]
MLNFWYRVIDFFVPLASLYFCYIIFLNHVLPESILWLGLMVSGLFLFTTQLLGGYSKYDNRTIARKLEVVLKGWIFVLLALVLIAFLVGQLNSLSRTVFIVWAFIVPLIVIALKVFINRVFILRINKPFQWLLVGEKYEFNHFEQMALSKQKIVTVHICHNDIGVLNQFVKENSVTGIVLNVKEPASNELVRVLTRFDLEGISLYSMNHFFESFLRKSFIPYDLIGVDYLDNVRRLSGSQYFLKRFIDTSVSSTLLLITLPVMAYSVYKIKRESPGSIFFKQSRVGQDAKCFEVIKFRSMHENSHFNPYTQENDSRVFPYGEFMRKSRVDELPQLWSVLKGDMHLCGPRTEWDILVDNYEKEIPFYHERHLIKPGITGWAQVMYPYGANTEDARQKLMYDLYYIKNWSIWLEMEVLIRTVMVVLGKRGV